MTNPCGVTISYLREISISIGQHMHRNIVFRGIPTLVIEVKIDTTPAWKIWGVEFMQTVAQ